MDYEGDAPGEMGVWEAVRMMGDDALDSIGYVIQDLSGDGIPELTIGYYTDEKMDTVVNAVYTLVDGKAKPAFEGWYRNHYQFIGDGYFLNYGFNSAAESSLGTFALIEDGTALKCESFLFTALDEAGNLKVYSNTTGSRDTSKSEEMDMSEEDFWTLDPPGGNLALTPFSAFGSDKPVVSVRFVEEIGTLTDCDDYTFSSLGDVTSNIVFFADRPVEGFALLSLTVTDLRESGDAEFEAYPEALTTTRLERPLVVELTFWGDTPGYGFQYEDENGDLRRFSIDISGMDGSLVVQEADRESAGFVLKAENETEP